MTHDNLIKYLPQTTQNAHVAIVGGSFNPPHLGHALLAQALLAVTRADQLWILPVADHPFHKDNVDFSLRIEMCRLNFQYLPDVFIVELEKYLPKPSYTLQTLQILNNILPDISFTFAFGSDIIPELVDWHSPELLHNYANILVYPRLGFPVSNLPDFLHAEFVRHPFLTDISSSQLRNSFLSLDPFDGRIHPDVLDFAHKHNLYQS